MKGGQDWDQMFFGAAFEPHQWVDALAQMANHTGSSHGQILGFGGKRESSFTIANDLPTDIMDHFHAIDGASPTLNYRIAACNRELAMGRYDGILHETHYDAELPHLRDDRYIQWCEEFDIPFGCQTNLVVDRVGMLGFAVLRKRREGRTTPQQRRIFAQAASAARRAVRLQERLEGEQARLLAGAFEAISVTAFVLDSSGRVQAMTRSAEELVISGYLTMSERLLHGRGMPLSLEQSVSSLVGDGGLDHLRLRIDGTDNEAPIFMEGFRLPQREWSLGYLPKAILLVKTPQRDRAGVRAFLTALYRLTSTEADIAMRLFDGTSRSEIAELRGVTMETLRG